MRTYHSSFPPCLALPAELRRDCVLKENSTPYCHVMGAKTGLFLEVFWWVCLISAVLWVFDTKCGYLGWPD